MKEQLYTITVDWADHKENCSSWYTKVVTCFVCGARGNIENNQ